MTKNYDVIVIGARCAGSPTAMLLARKGYRVLLVDKATFPSDTLSTHFIHAPGMAALARWGLADSIAELNCPAVTTYRFDFGVFTIAGTPRPADGVGIAYAPRRTVLDKILVDAAAAAGVEVRQGCDVDEIVIEDGAVVGIRTNGTVERASVVVGADGRRSAVAKATRPEQYNEKPNLAAVYYAYWSGVPSTEFEVFVRDRRGWGAFPTNDGLTLVVAGWPEDEFKANRSDIEGNYLKAFEQAPDFAARIRAGNRETQFRGAGDLAGFFRKPFGPGWALVGDAGYHKHPITAMGITDAFLDAERLVNALDAALSGGESYGEAMALYQKERDEQALPMYEMTSQFASLEAPPAEMQQLLAAVSRSQVSMDQFASIQAGTMPIPDFFDPENVSTIFQGHGRDASHAPRSRPARRPGGAHDVG
ncbi:MAG TPA: NAD(P)/FAD-dependent oxidoreductase [Acidimicrobiales bacterium]|nr:NAD(P)/FAD-dependent oxidoreductase [Acidimicrobiales bacterium]